MDISPFTLLAIGMITVFTVLVLVVLSGNLLINLVNKYLPEGEPKIALQPSKAGGAIEKNKLAAIMAIVEWATKGKGKVTKIEKKK